MRMGHHCILISCLVTITICLRMKTCSFLPTVSVYFTGYEILWFSHFIESLVPYYCSSNNYIYLEISEKITVRINLRDILIKLPMKILTSSGLLIIKTSPLIVRNNLRINKIMINHKLFLTFF